MVRATPMDPSAAYLRKIYALLKEINKKL